MRTIPDNDPNKPLKYNILWLISKGYVLDITLFYEILSRKRDMPNNKNKYRSIEMSLSQLQKEGWSIQKEVDKNGVAWYSAGKGFDKMLVERFKEMSKEFLDILDKAKRLKFFNILDNAEKLNAKLESTSGKIHFEKPEVTVKGNEIKVPLKLVPYKLNPIKKKD